MNRVTSILKDSTVFILKIMETPVKIAKDVLEEKKIKNNMYNQYQEMLSKYEKIEILNQKLKEVELEKKELEEMLELNASLSDIESLNATVIYKDIGFFYDQITIDKGEKNGIKKGMAVISNKGLIGEIIAVTDYTSTVELITKEERVNKISVKIEVGDNYVYGLLNGYDKEQKKFLIEGVSSNEGISKGAIVTTTGMNAKYPSGIFVGYVDEKENDNFDLSVTLKVTPSANFDVIEYVTVLKRNVDNG